MPDYPSTPGYEERRRNPELRAAYVRLTEEFREREERVRRRHRISEVIRNVAMVACIVFVWVSSFQGRSNLVDSQRAGCERSSRSYQINAANWRDEASNWLDAAAARRADGDFVVAANYTEKALRTRRRANRLNALSGVGPDATSADITAVCERRYPNPGPLALR